ncbi:MAG: hypothetical protein NC922_00430 [Candidatus Omnitrophica bacterium]|nr:hypothetical protein [Candidatus Omnitrophota bacterium]
MIKNDIEKIKRCEEESEKIIQDAQKRVKDLINSIDFEIRNFKEEQKEKIKKEIEEYKILREKEKEEKIKFLEKEKEEEKKKIKEKEREIDEIAQKIWKIILNELYSNDSIFS